MALYKMILTMLAQAVLFTSCKKDDPGAKISSFDIQNPEGYYIYVKRQTTEGKDPTCEVFEFMPAKSLRGYSLESDGTLSTITANYTIIDNSILDIPIQGGGSLRIEIKDGKIVGTNYGEIFKDLTLLKKTDSYPFSGKSFAGKYYRRDNSIFRNSFFYTFDASSTAISAGLTFPNVERTGTYELIGNFAALSAMSNGDLEFLVKVNNTLRTQYYDKVNNRRLYGEFTQQ